MMKINAEVLKQYLKDTGPHGELHLAEKSGISVHTILKLRTGSYKNNLSRVIVKTLCFATGIPESVLFSASEEKAG